MKTNPVVSVLDAVMVTRPVLLIPVWGFSALGFRCAANSSNTHWSFFPKHLPSASDYLLLSVFSLSVAAVYIFNQIADIEVDKKNGGLPLIASGIVPLNVAVLSSVLFSIISLLLPLLLHHSPLALCSGAALLLGVVYSFRPLRFSGKPILDFISNATGYGFIAFGAGWYIGGNQLLTVEFIKSALPYFLLMCAGSISSTLPDIEGDRQDGKITSAVMLGEMCAHSVALVLLIAAGEAGFLRRDPAALICALASLPLYIGYLVNPGRFFMEATYKIGGALCMAAAFLIMPWFLPVAGVVFTATWLYFRIRHETSYPSLIPINKS